MTNYFVMHQSIIAQEVFTPPKEKKKVHARRIHQSLVLDGNLNEEKWRDFEYITGFLQVEPQQGDSTLFQTFVKVLYDNENLYIGAYCKDTLGREGVRVQNLQRDFGIFDNDYFSVSIDGFYDQRNALAFQVTPFGNLRDLAVFDDLLYDRDWDGIWSAKTAITDSGWTVEMVIPFATLRYNPTQEIDSIQTWGILFSRSIRRQNQVTSWPLYPRAYSPYRMSYSADLIGIEPPKQKLNLRLQPYFLHDVQHRESTTTGNTQFGGEVKWAISSNDVLDVTVNTDFAQAEVDRQVINLTRFSVFFPERRQFFLENASLFSAGSEAYVQPFFSRRIGLDENGIPNPLNYGARFISRTPKRSIGAMFIETKETVASGANSGSSLFGVARFSQNVSEENRIGAMVNYRKDSDSLGIRKQENLVSTIDGFWRISPSWSYQFMVSNSQTWGKEGDGFAGYSRLGYNDNDGYIGFVNALISKNYNTESGFITRNDVFATSYGGFPNLRPDWKPKYVLSFEPDFFVNLFHGVSDGKLQEASITFSPIYIIFQSGARFSFTIQPNWQFPTETFSPVPTIDISEGKFAYTRYDVQAATDQSATYSFSLSTSFGGYFDGKLNSVDITLDFRPSPQLTGSIRWLWNEFIDVGQTKSYRNTHLLAPELRVSINPRLQLIMFYQYNTSVNTGILNARVSWEFAPLSFVYIIINDRAPINNGQLQRTEQGIFKVNYIHQF